MKQQILLFFSILWTLSMECFGQFDFDSLYQNSPEFRQNMSEFLENEDFFSDTSLLNITIETDFGHLYNHKVSSDYQKAYIKYFITDSITLIRKIKIKTRGNNRKKNCPYPPLTLNFPKTDTILRYFNHFDKLNFIGTCRDNESYEQYVLSEYLVYKVYNQISDLSLRVRLLRITYYDTSGKEKTRTSFAFIIEPVRQLVQRLNLIEIERMNIPSAKISAYEFDCAGLFNYMIGNTDWNVPALHNIKIFMRTDVNRTDPVIVPFDFDYAGIVNTIYSVPSDKLPVEKGQRYYIGPCRTMESLKPVIDLFMLQKDKIYNIYYQNPYISEKNRKFSIAYLDDFYKIISKPELIKATILSDCY